MLFNSYIFIFAFLPIALGVYYLLTRFGPTTAACGLIFISFFFYGWWNPQFLVLFVASIACNYTASEVITRTKYRPRLQTWLLSLAIAGNLSVLIYYKYLEAILQYIMGPRFVQSEWTALVLPLGISFFTFTQIGYLVDKKEGLVKESGLLHYTLFVSFFPHLIAGPILHNREMMPQFSKHETFRFSAENLAVGCSIFAFGLVKKTLFADTMRDTVARGFGNAAHAPFFTAWTAAVCYALQIYFDFSGYSDMAIGLARMFNIRFPVNFNSPFKATSIIDHWQRWHITLSRYLALYLYNPIGLAITRRRVKRGWEIGRSAHATPGGFASMVMFPTLVTMTIAGMWHGAGLQFLVFGVIHGVYLTINHAIRLLWPRQVGAGEVTPLVRSAKVLVTFLAAVIALVFFRSPSVHAGVEMLSGMIGAHGFDALMLPENILIRLGQTGLSLVQHDIVRPVSSIDFVNALTQSLWIVVVFVIIWGCPNTQQIMQKFAPVLGRVQPGPLMAQLTWRPNLVWAVALGAVLSIGVLAVGGTSEFVYFQF